jgi:hypothetical protein
MRQKSLTIILYVCILFVFWGSSKKTAFAQISASFKQTEVKKVAKLIAKKFSHGFLSASMTDFPPGKGLKLLAAACGGIATTKQGEIVIEVYKQP